MPTLAANLTMLFKEAPFLERFALARKSGFNHIEYLLPYEFEADELRRQLETNRQTQVLFNLPCGDWAAGDRGIAASPDRVREFREGVATGIAYARKLRAPRVNCLAGKRVPGRSDAEHRDTLVENARFAASALGEHDIELVIEAINHYDIPGFFLNRTDQVLSVIDDIGLPNVRVQYDIYHAQREEGGVTSTLRSHIGRIGHIQLADSPDRHEPGTGEINYRYLFRQLEELGYQGYVGLEYNPTASSESSFGWIEEYGCRR
ncbi:MAG: 2-oxo-tetronate isomerase [Vicinamibacterales bacterium]